MLFKELKMLSDGRIGYSYSVKSSVGESFDDFSSKCAEEPRESFDVAIKKLIPIYLSICEIDLDDIDNYSFKSIKFTRTGDEKVLGVHITCLKNLAISITTISIDSPLKFCDKANSSTESYQIFDNDQKDIIYDVLNECEKYAKGERLQIDHNL